MEETEIRDRVKRALHRIAPEADLESLPDDAELREAVDLDSMDALNFFVVLHQQFNVAIPEADYKRLSSVAGCVAYLREKLAAPVTTAG